MAETSKSEQLATRVILDEASWDAMRDQWDELYAASPSASTPLDFAWLRTWWRVFGPVYGTGGLRIVTVWRGLQFVAALPLYEHRGTGWPFGIRSIRFLSTGEAEGEETCPEYLNLLYRAGEEDECAACVWAEVDGMAWDHLEFLDLAEDSPLLRARNIPHNIRPFSRGGCSVADLGGGFGAYVERLSSNGRQKARRLMRDGERAGAQFEIATAEQAGGAFDDLVRLHQQRWTADGKPGVFVVGPFVDFHRTLVRDWLSSGRVVLARLSVGGEAVAVLYGFVTKQKFDFYQSGVLHETNGPLQSPGTLAHLLLMRAVAERGVIAYDFLRGSASYKERLATQENRLVGVRAWRQTPRAALYRATRLAGRAVRKGRSLIKGH